MGIRRIVGKQVLKRVTHGKVQQPGKIQALMRLPTLLRLGYALFRDSRVPMWQRTGALALVAFILSPLDIVGDIPIVGQFWDFTMAVVVLDAFIQMAPADVVNEHIINLGLERKMKLR